MKRMTKQILIILAAVLVIGGCSNGGDSETTASYSYTVTFNKNTADVGSTDASPGTKTVASPAKTVGELPKEPTRPGYEFSGWYTAPVYTSGTVFRNNTEVTADIIVYARWVALDDGIYSVNFDKNGGDTEADPAQILVYAPATSIVTNAEYDRNTLPKPPSKAGHLFDSWNTEADGSGDEFTVDTTVDDHTVVYAQWEAIPAGKVAVIFWDKEGVTQLKTVQIGEGDTVNAGDFPDKDTTVPYFEITSWKTADGTAFTSGTPVNATILNVYINGLILVGGTPYIDGDTVVHDYPKLLTSTAGGHGAWNGTVNDDGSFDVTTGAIRYLYSVINTADPFTNYDFVEIEYTASGVNSLVYKQYDSATDYPQYGSSGISNGSGKIGFAIRQATNGGFAIQKYNAGTGNMTIQITKITFSKGTRYTVSFSLGKYEDPEGVEVDIPYTGTSTTPADITVVPGLPVVTMPAAPVWQNGAYNFAGWYLDAATVVTATTTVTADFEDATLTAHWTAPKVVPDITVDFTQITPTATGTGTTLTDVTASGYTVVYGTSTYDNVYPYFDITFEGGINISDYKSVTFTYQGVSGDVRYKDIYLVAGAPGEFTGQLAYQAKSLGPASPLQINGTTATNIKVTIGTRALELSQLTTVRFSCFINAKSPSTSADDPGGAGSVTSYKISNVKFSQNP